MSLRHIPLGFNPKLSNSSRTHHIIVFLIIIIYCNGRRNFKNVGFQELKSERFIRTVTGRSRSPSKKIQRF